MGSVFLLVDVLDEIKLDGISSAVTRRLSQPSLALGCWKETR
ncbi:MAG TPA: hypothetical protein VJS64_01995 [Pyrinomonadaceae bacterium]|nr:hypothetical protein [Pyrinomonadaceae bacterium]